MLSQRWQAVMEMSHKLSNTIAYYKNIAGYVKNAMLSNLVIVLFLIISVLGFVFSNTSFSFLLSELTIRITRNLFLILSLIIPVLAGMGLNFSIVLGAMAGQIGLIMITHWNVDGIAGLILAAFISMPLSLILGYFTGRLFNKTKGQEMITGMILGFFAVGLYDLILLYLVGKIIPMKNPELILSDGVGIKNTIELHDKTKSAIDKLWNVSLYDFVIYAAIAMVIITVCKVVRDYLREKDQRNMASAFLGNAGIIAGTLLLWVALLLALTSKSFKIALLFSRVPVVTVLIIAALCLFFTFFMRTKIGQSIRTVGQDMHVARAAGIHCNRIRIVAIMLSTLFAGWGQLIFIQNMGNFNTYSSHEQVGTFAIAALLVGGASVSKATIWQALLGVILFHTLFIVSPIAGKNLFNDAQIGEYFRVFVSYGVIGLSLVLHGWKKTRETNRQNQTD
jgi:simple sugar transport system permease protein